MALLEIHESFEGHFLNELNCAFPLKILQYRQETPVLESIF